jgi:hypothetical protein
MLLAIAMAPPLASEALAWGDTAHRVVCEVAFRELDAGARERVRALIRRDPEFRLFADACTWPDHPRRRGAEHFVNLPRDADRIGADACPLAEACVITAVEAELAMLSSPTAGKQERLEALKFLGHWVGDVHRPLHVSFQDDRGGNAIRVADGPCGGDLHAVWDSCLVEQELGDDPRASADQLLDGITDAQRSAWRASGVTEWANESFAITTSPEVEYCVRRRGGCWYQADNEQLDPGEPEKTVVVDEA